MKPKIIAIVILLLLVGLPAWLYWYFFKSHTSGVTVMIHGADAAVVKLSGTFSNSWFPLADSALRFEQNCMKTCIFSPIAPVTYHLSITSDGFGEVEDNFSLANGQKFTKEYTLTPTAEMRATSFPVDTLTRDEQKLRNDDIKDILWPTFSVFGRDTRGRLWAVDEQNAETRLGIFQDNHFLTFATFPYIFSDKKLYFYSDSLAFLSADGKTILMQLTGKNITETTLPPDTTSVFFADGNWNAVTKTETLTLRNNAWKPNLRFTHWYDLGEKWRAGFIASDDDKRLSLSNFDDSKGSVLLLLDRQNGKTYEIARGLSVTQFSHYDGQIYVKTDWGFYQIILP